MEKRVCLRSRKPCSGCPSRRCSWWCQGIHAARRFATDLRSHFKYIPFLPEVGSGRQLMGGVARTITPKTNLGVPYAVWRVGILILPFSCTSWAYPYPSANKRLNSHLNFGLLSLFPQSLNPFPSVTYLGIDRIVIPCYHFE